MIGAHLADIHLGFRAFSAVAQARNAREVDVESAWHRAIEQVVEARPDLATIAGDVFHNPRVSMHAVKAYRDGIRRLHEADIPVIVLMGNHDAPRTSDSLSPIVIPDDFENVWIVDRPKRIRLETAEGESVSVACFPFVTGLDETYSLDPDPEADVNVLVMHAAVKGSGDGENLPYFYGGDRALDVGREADRWDVIAAGDFHEFTRLHEGALAFYSGSLERTSSNIWQEHAPKGWVLTDTDAGTMEFREVETRAMYDWTLAGLNSPDEHDAPPTAESLNSGLRDLALLDVLADAIVRLKIEDFPKEERQHIDFALVRELRKLCFHFYLDVRYAQTEAIDLGPRGERRAVSLASEAVGFFEESDPDVRELAFRYLEVTAEVEDLEEGAPAEAPVEPDPEPTPEPDPELVPAEASGQGRLL